MEKVFKVADIRDLEQKVALGEISYSKMVEIMNEKAEEHYSKVKKLNEPAVSKSDGIERKLQLAIDGLKGALRTGAMNRARFITNVLDEIEAIDNYC